MINSNPADSSPPVQAVVSVEFKNLDRPKDKPLVLKAEHSLIPRKKRRARFEIPVNTTKKEKGLRDPKIQQKPWKYSMLAKVADKASGAVLDQKEIHFVLEPMPKEEGKLPVKFGDPPPAPARKHTFKLKAAAQKPQALAPGLGADEGSVLKKVWKLELTAVEPVEKVKPSQLPFRTIRLKRISGNEKLPVLADVVTPGKAQVPAGAGSLSPGPEAKNRHDRLGVLQKAGDELYAKITLDQWLELSAERAVKDLSADLEAVVEASQTCLLSAWPWRSPQAGPFA